MYCVKYKIVMYFLDLGFIIGRVRGKGLLFFIVVWSDFKGYIIIFGIS